MKATRNVQKKLLTLFFLFISVTMLNLLCVAQLQAQQSFPATGGSSGSDLTKAGHFLSKQNKSRFEENKGQVTGADASKVRYTYKDGGLSVFLMGDGLAYQFTKINYPKEYEKSYSNNRAEDREKMDDLNKEIRTETYRMDVQLIGANANAKILTEGKSDDYNNYYNHNALDVHHYSRVTYLEIYPNIDWVIYTSNEQLKYDFVVKPGGKVADIKLKAAYTEHLELQENGSLILSCVMGKIKEHAPVSYQGGKQVSSRFALKDNIVRFNLGSYNAEETLIIDPVLEWATYYGGDTLSFQGGNNVNFGGREVGYGCATDSTGNIYMAGRTTSSNNIASGGYQNTSGGQADAFLVKFNTNGVRIWGTFYGGYPIDEGHACAVDKTGAIYVAGQTASPNMSFNGHQNTQGGLWNIDAFLVKFNSNGVRLWATYYGGINDETGYSCTVDTGGNVYMAGMTRSPGSIASGGHQNTYGGGTEDAFLVKFNSNGVRLWATYYGGTDIDWGYSCTTDKAGSVYLSGETKSATNIASGGHQNTFAGGIRNAFLVKFNSSGIRQWGTYYGDAGFTDGWSCATDNTGNIYMAGETQSPANIAFNGHQNSYGGGIGDAYLVKFNSAGIRQWATYYGGPGGTDLAGTCATANNGSVFLGGITQSYVNIAYNAYQSNFTGGYMDMFLAKFDSSGVREWGTYYGGIDQEWAHGSATDKFGAVYLCGQTKSVTNISLNGHQNALAQTGYEDAFLAKFTDCNHKYVTKAITICADQLPYTWNGITVNAGGNGVAVYHTASLLTGCDSATTLNLTINPLITATKNIYVCLNQLPYTWNGIMILTWGTGAAVYHTPSLITGCDSATTLNLILNPSVTATVNATICASQLPYLWNGITVNAGGTNAAVYHSSSPFTGCDSATTLNLTVNPLITAAKNITICANLLPYVWNGITVNTGGSGAATYHTPSLVTGCDSATTLNLTVNPLITATKNITICANQLPYVWNNITINASGPGVAVYHTPSLITGCDSATTLNLTANPLITATKNITICANQLPYVWNNSTINASGPGVAVYHTPSLLTGCDSATTLNLTVNPLITATKNITICANQLPYVWNNSTINASGPGVAVYHTSSLVTGCDSATTLNLTVNPLITATKNITICANQLPYVWNGITVNAGGTAAAVYHAPSFVTGCDSATTLNLTVLNNFNTTTNAATCFEALPYLWATQSLNASGAYIQIFSATSGCDSIVTLNLTVRPAPATFLMDTTACGLLTLYGSTYYTNTLIQDTLNNVAGCDSLYRKLNITISPNTPVRKVIDTAACDKVTFEGRDYFGNTIITDTLINASGCDSVARVVHIFVEPFDLNLTATPQEVYKGKPIHFETTANMPYLINAWSPTGWFSDQYIKEQTINALESGMVMVWGQSQHGCTDSAMVNIKVNNLDHGVFVPNAFSPNGDGLNDIFKPDFIMEEGYRYVLFQVFNRWGQRVYYASNVEQAGWDGRHKGHITDMGTYSYIIQVEFEDGEKKTLKGNVSLVR